ncbi:MAG: sulfurtransferase TusA family protein [Succinivibrio sp.]
MEIIILDCSGMCCPEPLTVLRNAVRNAAPGQIFHLISEDPVSLRDVPAFCKFMGHELISLPDNKSPNLFVIRKKSS